MSARTNTDHNLALIVGASNYIAGGVLRLSTIDYPGTPAAVIYCKGCNLHCPYCHNKSLVEGDVVGLQMLQAAKLCFRSGIEGVVITGGEPMLDGRLGAVVELIHHHDKKVKIDTNGLFRSLNELHRINRSVYPANTLFDGMPDYIAIDVKMPRADYGMLWEPEKWRNRATVGTPELDMLEDNIKHLDEWLVDGEFRTTVHRRLLPPEKLLKLRDDWLSEHVKPWYLQQFRKADCFDPSLNDEPTYTDEELAVLALGLGAYVRGVGMDLEETVKKAVDNKDDSFVTARRVSDDETVMEVHVGDKVVKEIHIHGKDKIAMQITNVRDVSRLTLNGPLVNLEEKHESGAEGAEGAEPAVAEAGAKGSD